MLFVSFVLFCSIQNLAIRTTKPANGTEKELGVLIAKERKVSICVPSRFAT